MPWYQRYPEELRRLLMGEPGQDTAIAHALGQEQVKPQFQPQPYERPIISFEGSPTLTRAALTSVAPTYAWSPDPDLARGVGKAMTGMTTGPNVGLLVGTAGLSELPVLGQAANAYFTEEMLRQAAQQAPQVKEAMDRGDYATAKELATEMGFNLAMGGAGAVHAVKGAARIPGQIRELATREAQARGEFRPTTGQPAPPPAEPGPTTGVPPPQPEAVEPTKTSRPGPRTPVPPTAAAATVPEAPQTLDIQFSQLNQGLRKAVMVPKENASYRPPSLEPGISRKADPYGNIFYYDTQQGVTAGQVLAASKNNTLPELLGGPGGMGAPDKSVLPPNAPVVTAKAADGTEVQSTATTPERVGETATATQPLVPEGGALEVKAPQEAIRDRLAAPGESVPAPNISTIEPTVPPKPGQELFRGAWEVPLNEKGVAEAQDAAQRTAGMWDEIHASPMGRAQETAGIVAGTNPQAVIHPPNPALAPWTLGEHEGNAVTPERIADLNDHIVNRPDEPLGGVGQHSGRPGESFNDFFHPLIRQLLDEVRGYQEGQRILNVTHYRDIRAIQAALRAEHGEPFDADFMTAKGDEKPGDLFYFDTHTGDLVPATDASKPGIYFLRHGETMANEGAGSQGVNRGQIGGKSGGIGPPSPETLGAPAPLGGEIPANIRPETVPASRQLAAPAPLGETTGTPPPPRPDAFSQFLTSEEGSFNPQFVKDALAEPIALKTKRDQMMNFLKAREGTPSQKKMGQRAIEYLVGQRDWFLTKSMQILDMAKKFVPDENERKALALMRDFQNRPGELKQWRDLTHPNLYHVGRGQAGPANLDAVKRIEALRPVIDLALNPTPGMQRANIVLDSFSNLTLAVGKKLGWLDSRLTPEEYVPHILDSREDVLENPYTQERATGSAVAGKISRSFAHGKERKAYDTLLDAIADGARPKTLDAIDAFSVYADKFSTKRATEMWKDTMLQNGFAKWGGMDRPVEGWEVFAPQGNLFKIPYARLNKKGEPVPGLQQLWGPKFMVDAMKPVTDPNYMLRMPWLQKTYLWQQYVKSINLAWSFFHPKALELMAASNMGPEGTYRAHMLDLDSKDAKDLEQDGAMHGLTTAIQGKVIDAYRRLAPGSIPHWGEIITSAPGLKQMNKVAEATTELTFGVMQRKFKIWDYGRQTAKWIADHPNATPQELSDAKTSIARQVNAVYGGLNWETLGWSRQALTLARLGLLAPDWTFSNFMNVGQAFEGGWKGATHQAAKAVGINAPKSWESSPAGNSARLFWIRTMLGGIAATQLMSVALTGKPSKRPTQVYLGTDPEGKEVYQNWFFAGAPGDLVNMMSKMKEGGGFHGPAMWLANKLTPITRAALQQYTGKTYVGKDIASKDMDFLPKTVRQGAYALREISPIPFSASSAYDMLTSGGPERKPVEYISTLLGGQPASHVVPEGMKMTSKGLRPEKPKTKISQFQQMWSGRVYVPEAKSLERMDLTNALRAYDSVSDADREKLKAIMRGKVYRARSQPSQWTPDAKSLAMKHFNVGPY
jgi:broad specificity phosphatase PhoE